MIVHEWHQITAQGRGPEGTDEGHQVWTVPVSANSTLVRTLAWFQLVESFNEPAFPTTVGVPVGLAVYHARNAIGQDLEPDLSDQSTDWVLWSMPEWSADFGVTSAVQSDLSFHAWSHVDSKAQRKILQSNPTVTVAFGPITGNFPPQQGMRLRNFTLSYVLRLLYAHED